MLHTKTKVIDQSADVLMWFYIILANREFYELNIKYVSFVISFRLDAIADRFLN